ncbi:hypothetical protein DPMN_148238 [Dreissena polymorpha]|uniref:Uncharacterized protein n=1 Tax=Dreissena polymorpha TaxID=45954 RepID=A0A9D4FDL4_DREPO|nr:hypothetical protein DPMN_148238 [Dreissena polymorpha]
MTSLEILDGNSQELEVFEDLERPCWPHQPTVCNVCVCGGGKSTPASTATSVIGPQNTSLSLYSCSVLPATRSMDGNRFCGPPKEGAPLTGHAPATGSRQQVIHLSKGHPSICD